MVINMTKNDLAIVVPCFNEEEILPQSIKKLNKLLNYDIYDIISLKYLRITRLLYIDL